MIIYGKQIFFYVLRRHRNIVRRVYLAKEVGKREFYEIKRLGVEIIRIDPKKAQALARGGNHQGYLLEVEEFKFSSLEELKGERFLIILYGVTDIGNIGSIVRTAYALGGDGIIISGLKNLKMEGVIRRSSGAALDLPIALKPNLYEAIKELQDVNFQIFAADMDGEDIRRVKIPSKRVLLLGSESEGLPKKALERANKNVAIKMARDFDSLNVASAAAIFIDRMRDE
ncbi:MAG: 23S rRNA (guanosine(2251)-2'-O)-methyltransferase RlmB [Epsilonproteobacteria bacterium]|nr:23S rRNA (guanosine(2251)-2'-O)-methyltransferase RlmB [Campylobacterota bacterium]